MIKGSFSGINEESLARGRRPVIFDILGPDYKTSLLRNYKLVLYVNPTSMSISCSKIIDKQQTLGGFVEAHFGEGAETISFDMATGGFVRVYHGVTGITGGGGTPGYRRQTLAYDSYLDMLELYKNNGAIVDDKGEVILSGIIQIYFDGFYYLGTFNSFSATDSSEKAFQLQLNAEFTVHSEIMGLRSLAYSNNSDSEFFSPLTTVTPKFPEDVGFSQRPTPPSSSNVPDTLPNQEPPVTEVPPSSTGFSLAAATNALSAFNKFTGEPTEKDIEK
jgi:hypothetical protein